MQVSLATIPISSHNEAGEFDLVWCLHEGFSAAGHKRQT